MSQDDYFSSPGGMNVLGLLKNPMALMMLFSAVMMYALPKMMVRPQHRSWSWVACRS